MPGPRTVRSLSDDEVIERVVQVRGIGRWTGEMLLMQLGRPDVLPATDLGIRRGYARMRGLEELPEPDEILAYGERWRPLAERCVAVPVARGRPFRRRAARGVTSWPRCMLCNQ